MYKLYILFKTNLKSLINYNFQSTFLNIFNYLKKIINYTFIKNINH